MVEKHMAELLTDGDLVIRVPADGKRGSGPFYLDSASAYGGNTDKVTVSWLVSGPYAWSYGLPREEVVPVGHVDADATDRLGNAFTRSALKRFRPAIIEARAAFYNRFPNFEDGRPSVHISELQSSMRGFMARTMLPELIELAKDDVLAIQTGRMDIPLHNGAELIVYAAPQNETDATIEPTAFTHGMGFTIMLAHAAKSGDLPSQTGYFAAPYSPSHA